LFYEYTIVGAPLHGHQLQIEIETEFPLAHAIQWTSIDGTDITEELELIGFIYKDNYIIDPARSSLKVRRMAHS